MAESKHTRLDEELARIIDPEAWVTHDYYIRCAEDREAWGNAVGARQAPEFRSGAAEAVAPSIEKVRLIRAAIAKAEGRSNA